MISYNWKLDPKKSTHTHAAAQAYMLQSAEAAEAGYKKKRKAPASQGPKTYDPDAMARAWERRSENVPTTPEEYAALKAAAPEFYRAGDSMLHGVRGRHRRNTLEPL